jgi:hypothetical protein
MNGCSSNLLAAGLSTGFLLKQHLKKSFPSGDRLSGIGGSACNTLNIAAGCCTTKYRGQDYETKDRKSFFGEVADDKLSSKKRTI